MLPLGTLHSALATYLFVFCLSDDLVIWLFDYLVI